MIGLQIVAINLLLLLCWLQWGESHPLLSVLVWGVLLALGANRYMAWNHQQKRLFVKLKEGLMSLQDGNFAVSLAQEENSHSQTLITLFNGTIEKLRKERQFLYQRELLLDKMMNSANVAMVIVDHRHTVSFANNTSELLFPKTPRIKGEDWLSLIDQNFPLLRTELALHQGALIQVKSDDTSPTIWHVFSEELVLHGFPNTLYVFKPVTEEMARQELKTWKKVIRVISHELNNSIAPISTMCHNGKLLASKIDEPHLDRVFNTIGSRVNHLATFVRNYSDLAKQKAPEKVTLQLDELLNNLQPLYRFERGEQWESLAIIADPVQLEQVFINLLKNAKEAAPEGNTVVCLTAVNNGQVLVAVEDEGPGIPPTMLNEVMLPFRSTKEQGSGIGLSVSKDIIDAHYGQLILKNKLHSSGLRVEVLLPTE